MTGEKRGLTRLRNIGIVAHINAGKTTLTERFLYRAGKQRFMGEVDEGTATMDFMPEEQERGISISAAMANFDWRGFHLNLIDTPGHVDFTAEVERSLRVLDGVIVVLDGVAGVESQTEILWQQVRMHGVPALVFINKLDRGTSDFEASLISLTERLGCAALPLVLPHKVDGEVVGLIDLVEGVSIGEQAGDPEFWQPSRQAVIEACADYDDSIMSDFVEGVAVEPSRLHRALRRATLAGPVVPVLAGSALLNRGVDWLLTAVCRYLPSPVDRPVVDVERVTIPVDESAPFCGLVFKLQFEGEADTEECLYFVRVYSGTLRVSESVQGSRRDAPVRVESIWRVHAAHREEIEEVSAGDVAAIRADADLVTGETLFASGRDVSLEPVSFPTPVLSTRVEAINAADVGVIAAAARRLCREDPTLVLGEDEETGAVLVSGMGELHLSVFGERLAVAVGREIRLNPPKVLMHETLERTVTASGECWRHLEGEQLSARIDLRAEPRPGLGPAVVGDVEVGDAALAKMLRRLLRIQLRAGLSGPTPAHDLVVSVTGAQGDLRGPRGEAVCGEALAIACRKLAGAAGSVLLEPYVDCSVACPAETLSWALADLRSRGARIAQVESGEGRATIRGELRLSAVLGYTTELRSLTHGLGSVQLRPVGMRSVQGAG